MRVEVRCERWVRARTQTRGCDGEKVWKGVVGNSPGLDQGVHITVKKP